MTPRSTAPQGVLPGRIHLDEAFTDAALRAALHERYPVVHIASHFQLHPGDDTASFLLLGDGSHLPLAQLKTWPQPFQGVELLTLSACNTAVGSPGAEGTEVEGLAVLAQRQGAKAVVATLWAVADTSTQTLMQTFYRLRESQPGLPKVEALRQAQLALLRGAGQPGAATPMESARHCPGRGHAAVGRGGAAALCARAPGAVCASGLLGAVCADWQLALSRATAQCAERAVHRSLSCRARHTPIKVSLLSPGLTSRRYTS